MRVSVRHQVDLENPFAVLPLDLLAERIKLNVVDQLRTQSAAKNVVLATCPLLEAPVAVGGAAGGGGGGGRL